MAVVICTSAPGGPGVTTTSLALALTWPRAVLLADCDRDPSQAVLAGYLRGVDTGGRGLPSIAQAHRENRNIDDELWTHTCPLSAEEQPPRRFLAGFTQPAAVRIFESVWGKVGESFAALDARGVDVVVDAGRIGVAGLPMGLLAAADVVVVITQSHLRSLAALRLHLPTLRDQLTSLPVDVPLGLGIVGANRPYGVKEIEQQFGTPAWFDLPYDAEAAAVLMDGKPEPKRFMEQGFVARARSTAKQLTERMHGLRASREALIRV